LIVGVRDAVGVGGTLCRRDRDTKRAITDEHSRGDGLSLPTCKVVPQQVPLNLQATVKPLYD
jgi:hypothetical protein